MSKTRKEAIEKEIAPKTRLTGTELKILNELLGKASYFYEIDCPEWFDIEVQNSDELTDSEKTRLLYGI